MRLVLCDSSCSERPHFCKNNDPLTHPDVVVVLTASATKEYEDYKYLAEKIGKRVAGKLIIYRTDGELYIEKTFEKNFHLNM